VSWHRSPSLDLSAPAGLAFSLAGYNASVDPDPRLAAALVRATPELDIPGAIGRRFAILRELALADGRRAA